MPTTKGAIVITGANGSFGAAAARVSADRGDRVLGTMPDAAGHNAAKKQSLRVTGKRRTCTVVGITWRVDDVNDLTQPHDNALFKEMQLDTVLGDVDA